MKIKNLISVALVTIIACGSQAQTTKPVTKLTTKPTTTTKPATSPPVVLKTSLDTLSYAIGLLDAAFFRQQGLENVNYTVMSRGFDDKLKGKPLLITPQQAEMTVREQLQALLRKKSEAVIKEGEAFLQANSKKPGVKVLPSGLQYEVLTMGTGPKPVDTSVVRVHYEGFLLNGFKFDTSRDRGEPAEFPLNRVIRGWTEGVQQMPVGSRFKFYIPYQMAYGEQGAPPSIPGGAALIFDVELIDIVNK
jgi:FKBP-type peptidyl-prolyl cis-trans isomerase